MCEKVKLGTILTVMHGYAFKSENYVKKSQYRLVTLGNFSEIDNNFKYNDEKATYYGAKFPKEFILQEGDLIMPLTEQVIGLFGNTAFIPHDSRYTFVLNQRVGKVICDEEKVDKYFIRYLLSTNLVKEQLEARASGTKQRNISPDDVYDVEVYLPDLATQRKIGRALYNLELKQISNQKIIENLTNISKTIFNYWFLQYEFPNDNAKPYKSNNGNMIWNEELKKEIPEKFVVKSLNEVVDMISGFSFSSSDYDKNGKYKIYTIKNVQDGLIISDVDNRINFIPQKMDVDCKLKPNDIIMSLTGNVGRVGLVYEKDALLNQRVLKLKPKCNDISYIYLLFHNEYMRSSLEQISSGTSQKNLSPTEIGKIKIAYPDENTLRKFCENNNNTIIQIVNYYEENEKLKNLRKFLLPLLMNGQVTFKNN